MKRVTCAAFDNGVRSLRYRHVENLRVLALATQIRRRARPGSRPRVGSIREAVVTTRRKAASPAQGP